MKKVIAIAASVLAVASILVGFQISNPIAQQSASALSGSSFSPGNIISDANFYDGDALSEAQIQAFLNAQIGTCSSSSCLNVGRYSMNSRGGDAMCSALTGGSSLSAATIIARVGAACGISPKVIIVTLQKEQALINGGTARNPSAGVLARAMGYACPDSANGGCDPAYSGVGNQVYWAAWQWKRYGNPAGTSNYFTWFGPGGNRAIQYNPNAACGTKTVYVENRATAALYYYTPYTPNTAALNNLYGSGDGCSAYGNRNFWRLYNDWFGSTQGGGTTATGSLDGLTTGYNSITVNGWALDTTSKASTRVDVYVGSVGTSVPANGARPDVAAVYPGLGSAHGFNQRIVAAPGPQKVCVFALSADGATSENLGCQTVTVPDGSPFGSLDSASAVPGGVSVAGWAIDPETAASLDVHVYADGKFVQKLRADQNRADVGRNYPSSGAAHGYAATVSVPAGSHSICVYGINVANGGNRVVGSCQSVNVPGSTPIGSLDEVTTTATSFTLRGWALDGDTAASIPVDVYVDGVGRRVVANGPRGDIARTFPAYGSAHGFSVTVPASSGPHQVCLYAINAGAGSNNTQLACRTVTVVNGAPIGSLDVATGGAGTVQVAGWAIDPDTAASIAVDVYVDGAGRRVTAAQSRRDVARSYPAAGPLHGWSTTMSATPGQHQVCAFGIDSAGGANSLLGCRSVTVS